MSRCYPYPPPGYAGKCSSHEALILSIKLQKEKEKALSAREGEKSKSFEKKKDKEDRKDRKRDREDRKDRKKDKKDKDERKKEKKEKRREKKAKLSANTETGKQNVLADKLAKADHVAVGESKGKLQGSSCELVERSSVTEEHGQPIDSQNVSCSSDSTGNSGKRRKTLSSPSGTQSNGNILRIRLSTSQKRDEPSTSGSKLQEVGLLPQTREDLVTSNSHVRPCAARLKPESSIKQKDIISNVERLPCPASASTLQLVSTDASGLKEYTKDAVSQSVKLSSSHEKVKEHPIEKLSSHERRMQKKDILCKKLFVDWVPPPLESTLLIDENDEEDWLFSKKVEDKSAKNSRVGDDVGSSRDNLPCSASYAMQPRARYLADAEIFALPFTVPF